MINDQKDTRNKGEIKMSLLQVREIPNALQIRKIWKGREYRSINYYVSKGDLVGH